jgi:nitrite reductase (NADH) large subunit|uniref:Nitrite reductase [NAD(P)H] n=1 Tax=Eutreptiella gymnastica TaxID=73025 RepID=A0A7S4FY29_9EUGL
MADKHNIVVVGHGMVGHHLLELLVARGCASNYNIIVFGDEPHKAYNRMQLSSYFAGKTVDDLSLVPDGFYETWGLQVHLNEKIVQIDRCEQRVISSEGKNITYDKLVFATGSAPLVPSITGSHLPGCFVYRKIEDLQQMSAYAEKCKRAVVLGGGLLGLEAAQAMINMGLECHVIQRSGSLMNRELNATAGKMLQQHVEGLGIRCHFFKVTKRVVGDERGVQKLEFEDGTELEIDMVIFSTGILPRDQLAKDCGLEVGPRGGIAVTDECVTTLDANVYAIGECVSHRGRTYGLVGPGNAMARVVADHIAGREVTPFGNVDCSTKLKIVGFDVGIIGDSLGKTPGCRTMVYSKETEGIYKCLLTEASGEKIIGCILVGEANQYNNILSIMLNDLPVPQPPESLILPTFDSANAAVGSVETLPGVATVCSCHNVKKDDICQAVQDGCHSMDEIKSCTKAGTGCGGCISLLTDLMNYEKGRLGISVKNHLCEHFPFSRRELHDIIRAKGYRDFDEVIKGSGNGGFGCEICKPTVASILATTFNKHVLEAPLAQLQDTNDYFLANMQRDGTYSVVPRIAGGELTPDALITLGQIGKDFDLYTKITGGQRIDFFGAKAHQLPLIWDRLVEAGFETGHAYGKSLRTVKTCVGSTWCRYGVQDSVGMGIALEHRYKGLRSPHKIKFAVSGCTRECAEAQSKDIGIIATKNGYNLYVCGNGGMKPRHADLLAEDLDPAMLVKLIDRVLMFYCRTADRLQRTSKWFEALDGGMDYLKSVVIDDKLGICEDLEEQMQLVVDTYQDEWATACKDPAVRARFKTFVNMPHDKQDPPAEAGALVYQYERKQKRLPVTEPANPLPVPQPALEQLPVNEREWATVCPLEAMVPNCGVCALVGGQQIAVFRLPDDRLFALSNFDPFSQAYVLSRGLVGDKDGVLKVSSPLYKQSFGLEDGVCLGDPSVRVPVYPVQLKDGVVQVMPLPEKWDCFRA